MIASAASMAPPPMSPTCRPGIGGTSPSVSAAEEERACDRRIVEVMARAVAKRSILAITADAAEHEPGLDRVQRCHPGAKTIHHAGTEALHDHIGSGGEAEKRLTPHGILEIDCQRALVAVEWMEHRRVLVDKRWHPAHVVAAGSVFDLDDIGAEVRKEHGAERPGSNLVRSRTRTSSSASMVARV